MRYNTTLEAWEAGKNEELRVFIDGVEDPTVRYADGSGNFTFPYTTSTAWSNLGIDHILTVDIPNASPYKSVFMNATTQSFNVYTDSKITPDSAVFAGYYLMGDSVTLRGTLTSYTVPSHSIVGKTVNVIFGGSSGAVTTGSGGVFTYSYTINQENPSGTFSFAGVPDDYLPAPSIPVQLHTLKAGDITISSLNYPATTFEQNNIQIGGILTLTGAPATFLPNRRMLVTLHNTSAEVTTDAQGRFNAFITVPNGVGTRDLNFTLLYANGTASPISYVVPNALSVGSLFDPNNPANPLPYGLVIGVISVIIAIGIVFILVRKGIIKLKRARPVYEVNQRTLMERVNALASMGRIPEAMAYLLVKYLDALRFRMQMTKKRGQTVRDIATEAVRRHIHQAEILYPWTSFVEAAVYSGRSTSLQDLETAKLFFQKAQQLVPFSEQELISLKPPIEPEKTPSNQEGTTSIGESVPKNNNQKSKSHDAT